MYDRYIYIKFFLLLYCWMRPLDIIIPLFRWASFFPNHLLLLLFFYHCIYASYIVFIIVFDGMENNKLYVYSWIGSSVSVCDTFIVAERVQRWATARRNPDRFPSRAKDSFGSGCEEPWMRNLHKEYKSGDGVGALPHKQTIHQVVTSVIFNNTYKVMQLK